MTRVFYSAFVWKCTYVCKHRFGVQLLQNPPLCSSTVVPPPHTDTSSPLPPRPHSPPTTPAPPPFPPPQPLTFCDPPYLQAIALVSFLLKENRKFIWKHFSSLNPLYRKEMMDKRKIGQKKTKQKKICPNKRQLMKVGRLGGF